MTVAGLKWAKMTHHNVVLLGVSRRQQLQRRKQDHVHSRTAVCCKLLDARHDLLGHVDVQPAATGAAVAVAAREVGRKLQLRDSRQLLLPVSDLQPPRAVCVCMFPS